MKAADVLNVKKSMLLEMSKVKAVCVDKEATIYKFTLPFLGHEDRKLEIFAYQRPKSRKIYLTDGGRMANFVEDSEYGKAFLATFSKLYGLTMMEDQSIMDISDRPMGVRVAALMQLLVAIDGIYRSLTMNKKVKETECIPSNNTSEA